MKERPLRRAKRGASVAPVERDVYQDCLDQADICREQACEAARLQRFTAALGLFSTATCLYQRADALDGAARPEARERLSQLNVEISAYTELAMPCH